MNNGIFENIGFYSLITVASYTALKLMWPKTDPTNKQEEEAKKKVSELAISSDFVLVFFDLEATGGSDSDEIIQIGAVSNRSNKCFRRYILPTIRIPPAINNLTGFSKFGNKLFQYDKQMPTTTLNKMLYDFLAYLEHFNEPVILVAHDAFKLDCQLLIKVCKQYGLLGAFSNVVQGICDSLPLFRRYIPYKSSYSLKSLVKELIDPSFTGHDAVNDAEGLASIFQLLKVTQDDILEFSCSFDEIVKKEEDRLAGQKNLDSLEFLQPYAPKKILEKMAKAGLNSENLRDRWHTHGPSGLKNYFSEILADGKPRITSDKRIISDICVGIEENIWTHGRLVAGF